MGVKKRYKILLEIEELQDSSVQSEQPTEQKIVDPATDDSTTACDLDTVIADLVAELMGDTSEYDGQEDSNMVPDDTDTTAVGTDTPSQEQEPEHEVISDTELQEGQPAITDDSEQTTQQAEPEADQEEPDCTPSVFTLVLEPDDAYTRETASSIPSYKYTGETLERAKRNTAALNEALLGTYEVVRLEPGCYPFYPQVLIHDCTLDMNGATLFSVEYKSKQTAILLYGDNVCLENGEVVGTYDTPDDAKDYVFHENEGLVSAVAYQIGTATIKHMNLHNCWGYAIRAEGAGNVCSVPTDYLAAWKETASRYYGFRAFTTHIDFNAKVSGKAAQAFLENLQTRKYTYISAMGNIGYDRIISDGEVTYTFYDASGQVIDEDNQIPRRCAYIPELAAAVDITIYFDKSDRDLAISELPRFCIGLSNYTNGTLYVLDCEVHNNHSLGMVGHACDIYVEGCRSYENGRPFHTSKKTVRSTTGFIDVEDIPTPYIELVNCTSTDELHFFMDGSFVSRVTGCRGPVCVYNGWTTYIQNHKGSVSTIAENTRTRLVITDSDLTSMYSSRVNKNKIETHNITTELCNVARYFKDFTINAVHSANTYRWLDGTPHGRLNATGVNDIFRLQLATEKGTDLQLFIETVNAAACGAMPVYGDCYGITSNQLLLPQGHTIHDCTFNIDTMSGFAQPVVAQAIPVFTGTYDHCAFNLTTDVPFNYKAVGTPLTPLVMSFNNCDFTAGEKVKHLFGKSFAAGSQITFENCTLNGCPCTLDTMLDFTAAKPAGLVVKVVNT